VDHAAAVGLAALAEGARLTLRALAGIEGPSLLLFLHVLAVLAAALWLGLGPGLLCTASGTLLVAWQLPPEGPVWVNAQDFRVLVLFACSATTVCAFIELVRRRRSRDVARMMHDATEFRATAGAEIRGRQARLEAILNNVVAGILTIDERGTVDSMNPAAERMFGYSAAEIVGRNVRVLMPSPYREAHDGYLANYLRTGERKIIGIGREVLGQRKDGSTFPIHLAVSEVPLAGQRLFTGLISDLSEQKRLEREFLQAQKLEAVGSLAGGIAHDFNNLLMGILACSRMAGTEVPPGTPLRELFDEIGGAAGRGIALTRRLLAFSRRQPVQLRATSINGVVRENETMFRQLLGEDVVLRVELSPGGAYVQADDGLIEQILINLLVNARDAMPKGGEIAVTTRENGQREVVLEVRDTGSGMPPEVQARIFEPFFTTKGPEKGTGLGLSTVRRIVGQLGGTIAVDSEVGRGTTFRLGFQGVEPRAPEPRSSLPRPDQAPAGKTILVAEDDRLVRASLRQFLEKKGFRPLVADSVAQALGLTERAEFDVLLTDMVLPDGLGSELARRIRARAPRTRVIFMSAHPAETLLEQGRLEPGAPYLEKPFEMEALDELLETVLTEQARSG